MCFGKMNSSRWEPCQHCDWWPRPRPKCVGLNIWTWKVPQHWIRWEVKQIFTGDVIYCTSNRLTKYIFKHDFLFQFPFQKVWLQNIDEIEWMPRATNTATATSLIIALYTTPLTYILNSPCNFNAFIINLV